MNQVKVVLVSELDEETGNVGLIIEGSGAIGGELNSASNGTLIAHDIIEHVNGPKEIGRIDDELEALGAVWFTRGQYGDLTRDIRRNYYSVEENVASDIARMFNAYWNGDSTLRDPPKRSERCDDIDYHITGALAFAEKEFKAEFFGGSYRSDDEAEIGLRETRRAWRNYKVTVRKYMRIGYNKAKARWTHGTQANKAFWSIADVCDPICSEVARDRVQGRRFELTWTAKTNYCTANEVYEDDVEEAA